MVSPYDAFLLLSFGAPESPKDVAPFLSRVTAGRGISQDRIAQVEQHYQSLGGISPLNDANRALLKSIASELSSAGIDLPLYWGNRNWHPLLADTLRQMADHGVNHALAFVTSAFASYSGCRQYLEDIEKARAEVGHDAPVVDKLRLYYNHPGFIAAVAEGLRDSLEKSGPEAYVIFSAHSIPMTAARSCDYVAQLQQAARLVAQSVGITSWQLAWQSRSGSPTVPWLDPDVSDVIASAAEESDAVIVVPLGFVSENMEIVYDLDVVAAQTASSKGLRYLRSATASSSPLFAKMVRQLVAERLDPKAERLALGEDGPAADECGVWCCPAPSRPTQ